VQITNTDMIPEITPITLLEEITLPTDWGTFKMLAFGYEQQEKMPHLAIVHPELDVNKPVTVRIHSECITGDLFHSKKCDCGHQLDYSMRQILDDRGIVIYLRQEGRGIGIINKMKAYNLQDKGIDTHQANLDLGLAADARNYSVALEILDHLKIKELKLLTNNPEKLNAFEHTNFTVVERLPILMDASEENAKYLQTKKSKFGHLID